MQHTHNSMLVAGLHDTHNAQAGMQQTDSISWAAESQCWDNSFIDCTVPAFCETCFVICWLFNCCCCRYLSRADYEGPHRQSAAFRQFKAAVAAFPFQFQIDGQSFVERNIGFML